MAAAAGLALALVCIGIVAAAFGLAIAAWRPGVGSVVLFAAGAGVGATGLLAASLHQITQVLP